jgi:hypothetical protein
LNQSRPTPNQPPKDCELLDLDDYYLSDSSDLNYQEEISPSDVEMEDKTVDLNSGPTVGNKTPIQVSALFGNASALYDLCESYQDLAVQRELGLVAFLIESKFYTVDWLNSDKWLKAAKPDMSKNTFNDVVVPELVLKNAALSLEDPRIRLMLETRAMVSPLTSSFLLDGQQCETCFSIYKTDKSFAAHCNAKGSRCKGSGWKVCKRYQSIWINGVKLNIKIQEVNDGRISLPAPPPIGSLNDFLKQRRDAIVLARRQ